MVTNNLLNFINNNADFVLRHYNNTISEANGVVLLIIVSFTR